MKRSNCITHVLTVLAVISMTACSNHEPPTFDESSLFQGINFVGVSVNNLEASTAFYNNSVNLEPVHSTTLDDEATFLALPGGSDIAKPASLLRSANAQLLFMEFPQDANFKAPALKVQGPGIAHVCYQVNKTTKTYQRFLNAGATPIGSTALVQLNDKNPVEYGYVRDTDGIIFEVEHVDVAALNLPEPPKNDYRIRHVSLGTPDMDRLVQFYSVLLDQPKPRRAGRFLSLAGKKLDKVSGHPDSKIQMAWFQTRNLELELIQYKSHPAKIPSTPTPVSQPGYNMIVFDVLDIAQAKSRILSAGGSLVVDTAAFPGGDIVFARDPDGNLLGLQQTIVNHVFSSRNFAGNGT